MHLGAAAAERHSTGWLQGTFERSRVVLYCCTGSAVMKITNHSPTPVHLQPITPIYSPSCTHSCVSLLSLVKASGILPVNALPLSILTGRGEGEREGGRGDESRSKLAAGVSHRNHVG